MVSLPNRKPETPKKGAEKLAEAGVRHPVKPPRKTDSCPLCMAEMYAVHCKMICSNCGYREDCSDIFPA